MHWFDYSMMLVVNTHKQLHDPEHEIAGGPRPISDHLLKMTEQSCAQSAIWLTSVCITHLYKLYTPIKAKISYTHYRISIAEFARTNILFKEQ